MNSTLPPQPEEICININGDITQLILAVSLIMSELMPFISKIHGNGVIDQIVKSIKWVKEKVVMKDGSIQV